MNFTLLQLLLFLSLGGSGWAQVSTKSSPLPANLEQELYSYPNAFLTAESELKMLSELQGKKLDAAAQKQYQVSLIQAQRAFAYLQKYSIELTNAQLNQVGEPVVLEKVNARTVTALLAEGRKFFATYKIPWLKLD